MLNEKQEFDLYLTAGYGNNVHYDTLKDGFKGIRRIFTVLARGFLNVCRENGITEKTTLHTLTIAFLKTWVTGTCDVDTTLPAALRHLFERAAAASLSRYLADNDRTLDVNDGISKWEKPLFEKTSNNFVEGNLNAIRFLCIVADALLQDPLKNEKLVLRYQEGTTFGLQGDFTEHHTEQLLSIVALYLQRRPTDCVSVLLPLADVSHYVGKPTNKGAGSSVYQSISPFINKAGYAYEGRPLFCSTQPAKNCNKLEVDAKWLADWDVHLAPADAAVPDGYVFYHNGEEISRATETVSRVPEFILLTTEVMGHRKNAPLRVEGEFVDDAFIVDHVRVFDKVN